MRSLLLVLFLLFFIGATPLQATVLEFGDALAQTPWRVVRASFSCRLVQAIPDFGRAELVQRGDGRLRFSVHAMPGLYDGQLTEVALAPAPW